MDDEQQNNLPNPPRKTISYVGLGIALGAGLGMIIGMLVFDTIAPGIGVGVALAW